MSESTFLTLLRIAAWGVAVVVGSANSSEIEAPTQTVLDPMARLLEERLVPERPPTDEEVNKLNVALRTYREQQDKTDLSPLRTYLAQTPTSPWRIALGTNVGLLEYHYGYFSRAIEVWSSTWRLGQATTDPDTKPLVDRAIGELARMYARLGRIDELANVLSQVKDRKLTGPATEWIAGANEGLWTMRNTPGVAFLCGPRALENVLDALDPGTERLAVIAEYQSGKEGVSLAELERLAQHAQLGWRAAVRERATRIPIPSIIHWRTNHYAAVVGEHGNRYHIKDPTFGDDLWVAKGALEAEASGFFLVPAKEVVDGWRLATAEESQSVRGRGTTFNNDPNATTPDDDKAKPPTCGGNRGCAGHNVHSMVVSLNIEDTPVGYKPGRGPPIEFTVTYNQREANQPATFGFSNLGQKWTHNWLAYIRDDPTAPRADVVRMVGGGGARVSKNFYNYIDGQFFPDAHDGARLVRVSSSPIRYELLKPDGSKLVFSLSDGASGFPRRVFLTQLVDPAGNTVTLNYDGQLRLTSIVDAVSGISRLAYGGTSSLQVVSFTDAAGRIARLEYDSVGRLSRITDAVGISSTFTYDASSTFVKTLTTPYGNTSFVYGDTVDPAPLIKRWLEITDPRGERERVEFRHQAPGLPIAEQIVPVGMATWNSYINARNTFYWDKHAHKLYPGDYTKAQIKHWLHDARTGLTARVLESTKAPLERRIWMDYPGAGAGWSGSLDKPEAIGRVHEDGSTQLVKREYNAQGKIKRDIDPVGRETLWEYSTDGIDLLRIKKKVGATTFALVSQFTWNGQRQPLTFTDAAGRTTAYTYNSYGQRTSEINAKGETTQYLHDGRGYLQQIINANGRMASNFTYDAAGNMSSRTDSEGLVITFAHDSLDRLVQSTYPDGTREIHSYTALDRTGLTDRLGRTTVYGFNAVRDLVTVSEPVAAGTTRTARYERYPNGKLRTLSDGNGNVTTWERDIQGRVTRKLFADGSSSNYSYDASGRLKSMTDALGQTTALTYTLDDRLSSTTYTNAVNATPNTSLSWDPYFERVSSMLDGIGTTQYTYHPIGSDGALQLAIDDGPWQNDAINYYYDPLGRFGTRNIQSGSNTQATSFNYDALGRLVAATFGELGGFTYTYQRETEQVLSRIRAGAINTVYEYEANNQDRRLKRIQHSVDAGISIADSYEYTSDAQRRILTQRSYPRLRPDITVQFDQFGYDAADRLIQRMATTKATRYSLDLADNLLAVGPVAGYSASEPPQSSTVNRMNQIVVRNGSNHIHDANGNLIADAQRTFAWDAANRLIRITYSDGSTTQFRYDGLNRRAVTIDNGVEVRHRWCEGVLCQTFDASSNLVAHYYPEGEFNRGSAFVYAYDHLGSVRNVVNLSGQRKATFNYDSYGKRSAASCTDSPCAPIEAGYAGLVRHEKSGLYLATYRVYDPDSGRWMSRDPISERGGINLYTYVNGNPLMYTDPDGLAPFPFGSYDSSWGPVPIPPYQPRPAPGRGPFPGGVCGSGWSVNWIPDGPWGDACQQHDKCYDTCGAGRLQCDAQFLNDSKGNFVYFGFIRAGGGGAYTDAQTTSCRCGVSW